MQGSGNDVMKRAFAAYFRRPHEGQLLQPSTGASDVVEHDGLTYAVLRNNYETLAVYRVRNDGQLKGLRRWPKELDNY